MHNRRLMKSLVISFSIVLGVAGCGTLPDGSRWGQHAFSSFESNKIARAARGAFCDPHTLIPLAGAAVFAIDDFDERASDWAAKHTPLFDSQTDAKDASDDLRLFLGVEALATAMATPSGDEITPWLSAKAKGLAVEGGAVAATQGLTGLLKSVTDRQRPDESNDKSFPSGHSSSAFAYATLANRNLRSIDLPEGVRPVLQAGNTVLAGGVAWARVEGHRHYPSDVLFGAALGHFMAAFIHDAFLDLPENDRISLTGFPVENGAGIQLAVHF